MADLSSFSRSSMKARKARARDVGDCMAYNPQRGDGEGQGDALCAVPYLSGVLGLIIVVKWKLWAANRRLSTMRGWGLMFAGRCSQASI
jgi:hypothetical protein